MTFGHRSVLCDSRSMWSEMGHDPVSYSLGMLQARRGSRLSFETGWVKCGKEAPTHLLCREGTRIQAPLTLSYRCPGSSQRPLATQIGTCGSVRNQGFWTPRSSLVPVPETPDRGSASSTRFALPLSPLFETCPRIRYEVHGVR